MGKKWLSTENQTDFRSVVIFDFNFVHLSIDFNFVHILFLCFSKNSYPQSNFTKLHAFFEFEIRKHIQDVYVFKNS